MFCPLWRHLRRATGVGPLLSTPLIWRRLSQKMACRYISTLTTARCTAPVGLMLLRHCRTQCHNVLTASLTGCARIASNSMPIRRSWFGACPLVCCCNYPAVCFLLLVHLFDLSWPECIYRLRPQCGYLRSANCVILFRRTPPASSIRHWRLLPFSGVVVYVLKTRLRQLCPGRASSVLTAAPSVCSKRCGSSVVLPKSL